MNFVSSRDIVVRSKNTGHSIEFLTGIPMYVPRSMRSEVLEKGILPVEDDGSPVDPNKTEVVAGEVVKALAPTDAETRNEKILEAMTVIVRRNIASEFTAGQTPSDVAVSAACGWRVDRKEVRQMWEKHRQELMNERLKNA